MGQKSEWKASPRCTFWKSIHLQIGACIAGCQVVSARQGCHPTIVDVKWQRWFILQGVRMDVFWDGAAIRKCYKRISWIFISAEQSRAVTCTTGNQKPLGVSLNSRSSKTGENFRSFGCFWKRVRFRTSRTTANDQNPLEGSPKSESIKLGDTPNGFSAVFDDLQFSETSNGFSSFSFLRVLLKSIIFQLVFDRF